MILISFFILKFAIYNDSSHNPKDLTKQAETPTPRAAKTVGTKKSKLDQFTMFAGKHRTSPGRSSGILM